MRQVVTSQSVDEDDNGAPHAPQPERVVNTAYARETTHQNVSEATVTCADDR